MHKFTRVVAASVLGLAAITAQGATEVIRLSPDQYNIFLFNDGSGFISTDSAVSDRVAGSFNCNTTSPAIFIPPSPELSDRVMANLLSAKVAGADIFVQVTDDNVPAVDQNCRFNGSTYVGIP